MKKIGIRLFKPFTLLAILALMTQGLSVNAQQWTAPGSKEGETKEQYVQRMQWWEDSRFGMFICWGPVSLLGSNGGDLGWARGAERNSWAGKGDIPVQIFDNLYKQWYPNLFNAEEWVQTAKDAGAKYIVFLAKHHDGFSLWDTKQSDYCVTGPESPWKVDVLKEIADACHKMDIKLVVYFSSVDWYHPDAFNLVTHQKYIDFMHAQLREICTNYGKIDGIWFDMGGYNKDGNMIIRNPKFFDTEKLFAMLHELQPGIILNNRAALSGDFSTPENRLSGFDREKYWEACVTLGTHWGWKPKDELKSLRQVISLLVQAVGGDGNLALNTNPMPDGRIEPRQVERFRELGNWLKENGESIYGTRGGPYKPGVWGASTYNDNKIYLHLLNLVNGNSISLPQVGKKIVSCKLLDGTAIDIKQSQNIITISVPQILQKPYDNIIVLELDGAAGDIDPIGVLINSVLFGKSATSNEENREWHPYNWAFDNDFATNWNCSTKNSWIEFDLGGTTDISKLILFEAGENVRKFVVRCDAKGIWKELYSGERIGEKKEIIFPQIKTSKIRIEIIESVENPVIAEILMF